MENKELLELLERHGVDNDYLVDMEGIESGSEEWMSIIAEVVGKDPYTMFDDGSWTSEDDKLVKNLINELEKINIELV